MTAEYRALDGSLPTNLEAEQCVLGSLLIDVRAIGRVPWLEPADFYLPVNGEIFAAMRAVAAEGRPTDVVVLTDYLQAQSRLEETGGLGYLASLAAVVPTSLHAEHYARIVRDHGVRRRMIDAGNVIAQLGYNESLDPAAAIAEAQRVLTTTARAEQPSAGLIRAGDVIGANLEKLNEPPALVTGLPTGLTIIDHTLGGLQREHLVVVAARPRIGKSAFAQTVVNHVCVNLGHPTAVYSLEMSREQVNDRLLSIGSGVSSTILRTRRLSDEDWDRVTEQAARIHEAPLWIDDTSRITTDTFLAGLTALAEDTALGVAVVDYLQLMTVPAKHRENRTQEVGEVSRTLKDAARKTRACVLALAQVNRQVDYRNPPRPVLADLKEAGQIEQDADVVIFLWVEDAQNPQVVSVEVAKNRHGPTAQSRLYHDLAMTRFHDLHWGTA